MAPNRRRSIKKIRGAERRGSTRYPPTTQYISGPAELPEAFLRRRVPDREPHGLSAMRVDHYDMAGPYFAISLVGHSSRLQNEGRQPLELHDLGRHVGPFP